MASIKVTLVFLAMVSAASSLGPPLKASKTPPLGSLLKEGLKA